MDCNGVLEISRLIKKYPGFQLGPISLRLMPGRRYGLLGPNGAGKTTLLTCISGQARWQQGTVTYNGRSIAWNARELKALCTCFQETPKLYDELTVMGNIRLARSLSEKKWDDSFASDLLARFALRPKQKTAELSKGNLVRLGIVSALARQTPFWFLDEPTAGLDPSARIQLQGIFEQLSTSNVCLVLSSHLFEDLESCVDEILMLCAGQLVARINLEDIRDAELVYVPEEAVADLPGRAVVRWKKGNQDYLVVRHGDWEECPLSKSQAWASFHRRVQLKDIYIGVMHG